MLCYGYHARGRAGDTMIIDVHVHPHVGRSLDDFDALISIAEQFDVQLVTYAVRPVRYANNPPFPDLPFIQECNDNTAFLMEKYPDRVHGFCYINPAHGRDACDELERRLSTQQFVGLKLWVAVKCDDPLLDPLMELCTHFNVPALQHTWIKATGNLAGESAPELVADLARRHPKATVIAAHAGGDYEYGAKVFRPCPNVLLDIAGNECNAGYVEILVNHVGADRVIFGTDMPGRSFTSQLAKVLGADLSAEDKDKILYKNMARVLEDSQVG